MHQVNNEFLNLKRSLLSYDGKEFTNHPSTVNDHYWTSLGNINNRILAVGDYSSENYPIELYDINSNTWTPKKAYPYCTYG